MEADDLAAPLAPELKKPSKSEFIFENQLFVRYIGCLPPVTITLILCEAHEMIPSIKGSIIVAG